MTRPLRYRHELDRGIGQHKFRPDPLTLEEAMGGLLIVALVLSLVFMLFSLEA